MVRFHKFQWSYISFLNLFFHVDRVRLIWQLPVQLHVGRMNTLAIVCILLHTLLCILPPVDNKGTCPIAAQCHGEECLEYEDSSRYKEEKQVNFANHEIMITQYDYFLYL